MDKSEFEGKRFEPYGPVFGSEYMFYIHDHVKKEAVCGMNSMTPLIYACRAMNAWAEDRGDGKRANYLDALQKPIEEDRKRMLDRLEKFKQRKEDGSSNR